MRLNRNLIWKIENHFNADYRMLKDLRPDNEIKDSDLVIKTITWFNSITGLDINYLADATLSLDPKLSGYVEYHLQNYLMSFEEGTQYRAFGRFISLIHRNGYSIFDISWESHRDILPKYYQVKCALKKRALFSGSEPLQITNDKSTISFYLER